MSPSADLLTPEGPFASGLARYESRPGQVAMAAAVERALSEQRLLICEAGTGTGKTLAYLVPALLSGRRVVVSTATRALQEQIANHDLPLIERTLGRTFDTAVMKGVGNYVCRRRLQEFRTSPRALGRSAAARRLPVVERWVEETESGDIADLSELAENDAIWGEVTASTETRIGARCQHYRECFVTQMRERAESAQLIIANHHLFCADLALRGAHPGKVLPDYDAVIFDEAHQLESVATRFFGVNVSRGRIERLVDDAGRVVPPLLAGAAATRIFERVRKDSAAFWDTIMRIAPAGGESRFILDEDAWDRDAWHALDDALDVLYGWAETVRDTPSARGRTEQLDVISRRTTQLREALAIVLEGGRGRISWVEIADRNPRIGSSPVEVGEILYERLFEYAPAVVLTSATLATTAAKKTDAPSKRAKPTVDVPEDSDDVSSAPAKLKGPFAFVRNRLGLTAPELPVDELLLESPFDFPKRALLYIARDLPAPRTPGFDDAAASRIADLIELTRGGAFVLTTSLKSMHALHGRLAKRLPGFRLLLQTSAPKNALLEEFRAHGDAVLVATQSFWEGVDVPGDALRLVVLEKIPFQVPTDPLVRARDEACRQRGGNPFMELHVPSAAINLKQGFGRLIRSSTDRGIVALLDDRIVTKGYGKRLLSALPPASRAEHLDAVRDFWAEAEVDDDATLSAAPLPPC